MPDPPHTALHDLSPAYFAMAMATGIISIASSMLGLHWLAHALFALNIVIHATLWALYLLRFRRYRAAFLHDLGDHLRGSGFFTVVAATGVLGSQVLLLTGQLQIAAALWGFTLLLWVVLTYGIFAILTVEEDKPPLEQGINGGWLTVFYWATGTWWIPMLLVLGIWRHSYKRFPLRYDPLYWGAVFPLGMYAASTHELSLAMRLDFLAPLPVSFLYVALLAWTAAFVGALRQLLQAWRKPPGHRTTG